MSDVREIAAQAMYADVHGCSSSLYGWAETQESVREMYRGGTIVVLAALRDAGYVLVGPEHRAAMTETGARLLSRGQPPHAEDHDYARGIVEAALVGFDLLGFIAANRCPRRSDLRINEMEISSTTVRADRSADRRTARAGAADGRRERAIRCCPRGRSALRGAAESLARPPRTRWWRKTMSERQCGWPRDRRVEFPTGMGSERFYCTRRLGHAGPHRGEVWYNDDGQPPGFTPRHLTEDEADPRV